MWHSRDRAAYNGTNHGLVQVHPAVFGIRVHQMYGDRNFAYRWINGELASLAMPWSRTEEFF